MKYIPTKREAEVQEAVSIIKTRIRKERNVPVLKEVQRFNDQARDGVQGSSVEPTELEDVQNRCKALRLPDGFPGGPTDEKNRVNMEISLFIKMCFLYPSFKASMIEQYGKAAHPSAERNIPADMRGEFITHFVSRVGNQHAVGKSTVHINPITRRARRREAGRALYKETDSAEDEY
ncbi:hypothetical protein T439DRAFT_351149 [Meredithblackwellia eburnea MCA 4105]